MNNSFDTIASEIMYDPNDYSLYLKLGDYYMTTNINQAYICYEHALFLCSDSNKKLEIEQKMDSYRRNPEFCVSPCSFIILSYNSTSIIAECLDSIRATCSPSSYEIVVIDSSTEEETKTYLKNQDDISVVFNEKFDGFASGCNQGIKIAKDTNDIFLLNNDTILLPQSLLYLRLALYSQNDVGAVGPISNNAVLEQKYSFDKYSKEEWLEIGKKTNIPSLRYQPGFWLQGHALLIKRLALDIVGALDTRFIFGTSEDNDYGIKLNSNGFKTLVCRNSFIFHYGGVSMEYGSSTRKNYERQNLKLLNEKWGFNIAFYDGLNLSILQQVDSDLNANISILDIGCGLGSNMNLLSFRYKNGNIYGIESNERVYNLTRHYANVLLGDFETMSVPYSESSFDFIIIQRALQFCNDPIQFINKASSLLRPGGKLIVGSQNPAHISVIMALLKGKLKYNADTLLYKEAKHYFTPDDLIELGHKADLLFHSCVFTFDKRFSSFNEDTKYIKELAQNNINGANPNLLDVSSSIVVLKKK